MITAITNSRIFDGERVLDANTVIIDGQTIATIGSGSPVPNSAAVIDASGAMLLPGLIDAYVHTRIPHLRSALQFGVTTELEMMGHWTPEQRREVASAEFGLTVSVSPDS